MPDRGPEEFEQRVTPLELFFEARLHELRAWCPQLVFLGGA
jgi:hypothetical protein